MIVLVDLWHCAAGWNAALWARRRDVASVEVTSGGWQLDAMPMADADGPDASSARRGEGACAAVSMVVAAWRVRRAHGTRRARASVRGVSVPLCSHPIRL